MDGLFDDIESVLIIQLQEGASHESKHVHHTVKNVIREQYCSAGDQLKTTLLGLGVIGGT